MDSRENVLQVGKQIIRSPMELSFWKRNLGLSGISSSLDEFTLFDIVFPSLKQAGQQFTHEKQMKFGVRLDDDQLGNFQLLEHFLYLNV